MKILVIDSGGRGNALAWKLHRELHEITVVPGNPGSPESLAGDINNNQEMSALARGFDFTVVGPEIPLSRGIVDHFNAVRLPIFGPNKIAAEIETDKCRASIIFDMTGIPAPRTYGWKREGLDAIKELVAELNLAPPFVIKHIGPVAGKGVEVIRTTKDLPAAYGRLAQLPPGGFLLQEYVEGPEMSYFVPTDGVAHKLLGSAADYKPIYEHGPNTGGMGGFSPHPALTPELQERIEREIVVPTIKTLRECGNLYRGVLYFQLMLTKDGPKVIEINARFGDPETQMLMELLDSDLYPYLLATTLDGALEHMADPVSSGCAVAVVLSAFGYPGEVRKGDEITGITQAEEFAAVYHAGTAMVDGKLVTAGGRVLTVVGKGKTFAEARENAYKAARLIQFNGKYYREDIALPKHLEAVA